MTTTSTATTRTSAPDVTSRPSRRYLVVAAPVGLLVARLLATPISNKPRDFVADVHASAGQTEVGAALAIVAAALLAWTLVVLAQAARTGSRRLSTVARVLTNAGCVGMITVSLLQGIGARLSVQGLSAQQGADAFDAINNKGVLPVLGQLCIVAGVIGSVLLGVALYRQATLPRVGAVISGAGSLLLFATAPGPVQPLLVAAAAVAAVGYFLVSRRGTTGS